MEKYASYGIEDFLTDDGFINWILFPDVDSNQYWKNVQAAYPHIIPLVEEARAVLLNVTIKPYAKMPINMKADLMANIQAHAMDQSVASAPKILRCYKRPIWAVAAAILLTIGTFLYIRVDVPQPQPVYLITEKVQEDSTLEKVINNAEKPLVILLPDNSLVILDPAATLLYDAKEFTKDRTVYLTGNAFFEIESMPHKPFFVHTKYIETKVLGTSFRISASQENPDQQRVTVNTGLVEVKSGRKSIQVSANQEAVYEVRKKELTQEIMSEQAPLSQEVVQELFRFQESPLQMVVDALADQYHISIEISDEELAKRTITLSLGNMHLYEKLELICKAVEAQYQLTDGHIIISKSKK